MSAPTSAQDRPPTPTADDHIAEAQRLLAGTDRFRPDSTQRADVVRRAQAHATLALALQGQDAGICDHGNTGVCMSCVIQHDLLRPSR